MTKRRLKLDDYDTAANLWTLSGWSLGDAVPVTNTIDVPGRIDGPLDASTVLTDGDVRYGPRPFEATLETSEGTRLERKARIDTMINKLHGQRVKFWLPDDADHYLVGRFTVSELYNDLAHAAVTVTATCEPWKYAKQENVSSLYASASADYLTLYNDGRRAVVPLLTVEGGEVSLTYATSTIMLGEGVHKWPTLLLTPGTHDITYSGSGQLTITYREAVL